MNLGNVIHGRENSMETTGHNDGDDGGEDEMTRELEDLRNKARRQEKKMVVTVEISLGR
jgi:hypothetical protein